MEKQDGQISTTEEILNHPSYLGAIWKLEPHQSGLLPVAGGGTRPQKISWEVHGEGEINVLVSGYPFLVTEFINGTGSLKSMWQPQTLYFGHEHGDKYSVLLTDTRGMGDSDKRLVRSSTSEMAKDLLKVLEYLGWSGSRQLHVVGLSLGGMIAQELACMVPDRISTLNLISTSAQLINTSMLSENMMGRISMILPRSIDRIIVDTAGQNFTSSWLSAPDDVHLPAAATPKCMLPPNGAYGKFDTNFQRFSAQELVKRQDQERFGKAGLMLQVVAVGFHRKTRAQLKEMADRVGRERILVVHGTEDHVIPAPHGQKLIEYIEPSVGIMAEGLGHGLIGERWAWINGLLEERFAVGEKLGRRV
ncbi:Alpha/Beta hydrolase protein [Ilyonectria robusta]|uniref:Alpha/Beta hydrolase protein n=1 Tax=Ilyonectria robusta TaxID=1079257 RepID=UPI001E8EB945|nr:Alpha/Beta hydrolase protein [Ilyonectria robusta]KAH8656739.1 Alpha/Beta hydrolase protein [Ilyonectria robusta]